MPDAMTTAPIPLSTAMIDAIRAWAADDRLWSTKETTEFNLCTFARLTLKLASEEGDTLMDTRDGTIYPNLDEALKAGVPEDRLVSGSREALDDLRSRIQFHKPGKGPFKPLPTRKVPAEV